jgi:hypothetical protein
MMRLTCAASTWKSDWIVGRDGVSIPSMYITTMTIPARITITRRVYAASKFSSVFGAGDGGSEGGEDAVLMLSPLPEVPRRPTPRLRGVERRRVFQDRTPGAPLSHGSELSRPG